jgi:transcriptional regulator with XRE-family HTH domain
MNLDDRQFLKGLGVRLRDLRLARNLTQAEFAEQCDLHRTFIGSVERGERNVSILNLRLIARILRVTLSELLDESTPPRSKSAKVGGH